MPGRDGTGPAGLGPASGRVFGYCERYPTMRGGMFCRGFGFYRAWSYYNTQDDEKKTLEQQAEFLKKRLHSLEERLQNMGKSEKEA